MSGKSKRGFASMDPSRQRAIASKGGKAAHAKGTAHEWTSDEAREAGRKGGEVVSRDRAHMAAIGREGGEARGRSRARVGASGNVGGATQQRYSDREASVSVSRELGASSPRRDVERQSPTDEFRAEP
ncbi:MAG TPA: KGG domain-containing protein [Gemmatimonadaceae bacterium]|nr:KGG domain-containing protein [Gemmatimonadaceae bacterium]